MDETNGHLYAVIMAGGSGTRLWPLSRRGKPKQVLAFAGQRSLFQMAVDRLDGLVDYDHIYVVTVAEQARLLQDHCAAIPAQNYLIEPMPRGTAAVVGLAAAALKARDPRACMAVVTADHLISNAQCFRSLLAAAQQVASQGYLVTLGITPSVPMTGYGYIQRGERLADAFGKQVYRVSAFKEKPDLATAQRFVLSGDHYWNSGMFAWMVDDILAEFERCIPELYTSLQAIAAAWNTSQRDAVIQAYWPLIKPQSIDYGVMEKARQVAVLPASDLGWSDVGSWESLLDALPADENGNVVLGAHHFGIDTHSSLVLAENPQRLIATIGVSDLVVIDSGDALLICRRSDSQKVRDVVDHLKNSGQDSYL